MPDLTYVSTGSTPMVLDAIEQANWTRHQGGVLNLKDVAHHTGRRSRYTSIRFSERLAEAGIQRPRSGLSVRKAA